MRIKIKIAIPITNMAIALKIIIFSLRKNGLMPDTTVFTVFSAISAVFIAASLIFAGSNATMSAPDERSIVSIEFVRDVDIYPNTKYS